MQLFEKYSLAGIVGAKAVALSVTWYTLFSLSGYAEMNPLASIWTDPLLFLSTVLVALGVIRFLPAFVRDLEIWFLLLLTGILQVDAVLAWEGALVLLSISQSLLSLAKMYIEF